MASPYKPKTAQSGTRSQVGRSTLNRAPGGASINNWMRKFKDEGNNRTTQYVETSTLLEPNNFIPSWVKILCQFYQEAGGEEKKEVSSTLRKLRMKYDNVHKTVLQKEKELEELKVKLDKQGDEEVYVEDTIYGNSSQLQALEQESGQIQRETDFDMMYQRSYAHMLDRMKKDLISNQINSNDLHDSFKQKLSIKEEEIEKSRKSKEQRMQAKLRLDTLMKNIDLEQQKRQERIQSLQKSIRNKEEALQRRMDRVRRQQEIAEAAASENKDSNELKMQENFMVQRLYSAYLKKKMEKEMKRTQEVEEAFQKIKAATGYTDVQDIVHKFLTREQTYSQLLMAVSDNERKIDELRKQNEQWREKLQDLQMQNEGNDQQKSVYAPEISKLDGKILKLSKDVEKVKDIHKTVKLVDDQVKGWTNKLVSKVDQHFNENISAFEGNKPISFIYEKMTDSVLKQLQAMMAEEDEEDRGFITQKDFMNDFATEDFLNKNIRVRPVSGVTKADEEKFVEIPHQSKMDTIHGDEEEKFNKMMQLEIEEQRKNVKTKRDDNNRRKYIEEERAKKKNK